MHPRASSSCLQRSTASSVLQIAVILLLMISTACATEPANTEPSAATKKLLERNKMFEKRVYQVADNVYVALGYQVSANGLIVGDDGVIIVDPGMAPPMAMPVVKAFQEVTDKPVKAIIYTHGHFDHVGGSAAFYKPDTGIQVWARDNFDSEESRNKLTTFTAGIRPSNTQGFDLKPEQKTNIGIAIPPNRQPPGGMMRDGVQAKEAEPRKRPKAVKPTHTFSSERQKLTIAGVNIELVKAPGETEDQLYVWLPDSKVLFAGDNFYQSWPNVYPLRGTARRSVRDWIDSLGKMIAEQPKVLVGGHTTPITENTDEILKNYRDALKWVYDRTIEGAKKYMSPDELVEYAALPEHLADLDYLQDYYGSVEGSVRDIYTQDLGWFDGKPLTLHRGSPAEQANRMVELAGGLDQLKAKAMKAMNAGDAITAAHFAQHLLVLEPENREFNLLMADALASIGEKTFNAPMRNYTVSSSNRYRKKAAELENNAE